MRLTTRSAYGIRALVQLAVVYDAKRPVPISDIARGEELPGVYLEQIFNRLKKGGLVKSTRGTRGGYMLSREPSKVSVFDAVTILEGKTSGSACIAHRGNRGVCVGTTQCVSKEVWDEVSRQVENTLRRFSLEDLAVRVAGTPPREKGKHEKVRHICNV